MNFLCLCTTLFVAYCIVYYSSFCLFRDETDFLADNKVWLLISGGNDKNAVVFNKDTEQVVAILQGHTKKVTDVIYHPDEVVMWYC